MEPGSSRLERVLQRSKELHDRSRQLSSGGAPALTPVARVATPPARVQYGALSVPPPAEDPAAGGGRHKAVVREYRQRVAALEAMLADARQEILRCEEVHAGLLDVIRGVTATVERGGVPPPRSPSPPQAEGAAAQVLAEHLRVAQAELEHLRHATEAQGQANVAMREENLDLRAQLRDVKYGLPGQPPPRSPPRAVAVAVADAFAFGPRGGSGSPQVQSPDALSSPGGSPPRGSPPVPAPVSCPMVGPRAGELDGLRGRVKALESTLAGEARRSKTLQETVAVRDTTIAFLKAERDQLCAAAPPLPPPSVSCSSTTLGDDEAAVAGTPPRERDALKRRAEDLEASLAAKEATIALLKAEKQRWSAGGFGVAEPSPADAFEKEYAHLQKRIAGLEQQLTSSEASRKALEDALHAKESVITLLKEAERCRAAAATPGTVPETPAAPASPGYPRAAMPPPLRGTADTESLRRRVTELEEALAAARSASAPTHLASSSPGRRGEDAAGQAQEAPLLARVAELECSLKAKDVQLALLGAKANVGKDYSYKKATGTRTRLAYILDKDDGADGGPGDVGRAAQRHTLRTRLEALQARTADAALRREVELFAQEVAEFARANGVRYDPGLERSPKGVRCGRETPPVCTSREDRLAYMVSRLEDDDDEAKAGQPHAAVQQSISHLLEDLRRVIDAVPTASPAMRSPPVRATPTPAGQPATLSPPPLSVAAYPHESPLLPASEEPDCARTQPLWEVPSPRSSAALGVLRQENERLRSALQAAEKALEKAQCTQTGVDKAREEGLQADLASAMEELRGLKEDTARQAEREAAAAAHPDSTDQDAVLEEELAAAKAELRRLKLMETRRQQREGKATALQDENAAMRGGGAGSEELAHEAGKLRDEVSRLQAENDRLEAAREAKVAALEAELTAAKEGKSGAAVEAENAQLREKVQALRGDIATFKELGHAASSEGSDGDGSDGDEGLPKDVVTLRREYKRLQHAHVSLQREYENVRQRAEQSHSRQGSRQVSRQGSRRSTPKSRSLSPVPSVMGRMSSVLGRVMSVGQEERPQPVYPGPSSQSGVRQGWVSASKRSLTVTGVPGDAESVALRRELAAKNDKIGALTLKIGAMRNDITLKNDLIETLQGMEEARRAKGAVSLDETVASVIPSDKSEGVPPALLEENKRLRAENASYESVLQVKDGVLKHMQEEINALASSAKTSPTAAPAPQPPLPDDKLELRDAEKRVKELERAAIREAGVLRAAEEEVGRLEREYAATKEQVAAKDAELAAATGQLKAAEDDIASLQAETARQRTALDASEAELKALKAFVLDLNEENRSLRRSLSDAEAAKAALQQHDPPAPEDTPLNVMLIPATALDRRCLATGRPLIPSLRAYCRGRARLEKALALLLEAEALAEGPEGLPVQCTSLYAGEAFAAVAAGAGKAVTLAAMVVLVTTQCAYLLTPGGCVVWALVLDAVASLESSDGAGAARHAVRVHFTGGSQDVLPLVTEDRMLVDVLMDVVTARGQRRAAAAAATSTRPGRDFEELACPLPGPDAPELRPAPMVSGAASVSSLPVVVMFQAGRGAQEAEPSTPPLELPPWDPPAATPSPDAWSHSTVHDPAAAESRRHPARPAQLQTGPAQDAASASSRVSSLRNPGTPVGTGKRVQVASQPSRLVSFPAQSVSSADVTEPMQSERPAKKKKKTTKKRECVGAKVLLLLPGDPVDYYTIDFDDFHTPDAFKLGLISYFERRSDEPKLNAEQLALHLVPKWVTLDSLKGRGEQSSADNLQSVLSPATVLTGKESTLGEMLTADGRDLNKGARHLLFALVHVAASTRAGSKKK